jgi:hypothetical protein
MTTTLLFAAMLLSTTAQAFEFDVEPLLRGQNTTFRVSDGTPGHVIEIVRSSQPPVANASCPGLLGGACLDLVAPARVASLAVSGNGEASVHPLIPMALLPRDVWFQAIDFSTGEKSPVVHGRVLNLCAGNLSTDVPNHLAVLTHCGALSGSLEWRPVDGVLPELPWLQEISGSLIVQPGRLVTQVAGPARLREVGALVIEDAPNLEAITGFDALRQVRRITLDEIGEPSLIDLFNHPIGVSELTLVELPWLHSLAQLGPLPPLRRLHAVRVNLVDLTGMHPASVPSLRLRLDEVPLLQSLQGVSPLSDELMLEIEDAPLLVDLSGLEGAVSAPYILVSEAPMITDLSALSGLEELSWLQLSDMAGVTTVQHLAGAIGPETSDVMLVGMPALASLAGLEGLSMVGYLHLFDLPLVDSLAPLASVVDVYSELELELLPSLPSLDGLQALTAVGWMEISGNALLTDVSALSGLNDANRVVVRDNPLLCEDEVYAALANTSVPFGVDIGDNGACP